MTWDLLAELLLHRVVVLEVGGDGDSHRRVQAQPLEPLQEDLPAEEKAIKVHYRRKGKKKR